MSSLRFGFTPFGLRTPSPPPSGWTTSSAPVARKRPRWVAGAAALALTGALGSWFAVRTVPWFGPFVADSLRSVVGGERVTELEEAVADVEDHVEKVTTDGKARSLNDATPAALLVAQPEAAATLALEHRPADVTAPYAGVAAEGDGSWTPVPTRAGGTPAVFRTMLHPDADRSYAELFVFALDLSRLEVHAEAGSIEPKNPDGAETSGRPGVVPENERGTLVAAFNGGFKAEHGQFGMMVDGRELLAPKPLSCTIASTSDGALTIAPWNELKDGADQFSWWRQTPGCMLENGVLHPGLRSPDTKNWGATIDGNTVIRRSAVGLGPDGKTLFVGISNSTTARAMALGMKQAGATNVAQLDVNFSFPRFLVYEEATNGKLTALGAVKGLLYEPDEYLGHSSTRDFFYVTAR
ncbi:MAG TPA: phosphodiester glycosidase family protein [Polyangiaceae bacterium]|nr:phosphodiester glycosidase family protein [Polyangiaceae bacterium]